MLEEFLNKALEAEMDDHLDENKGNGGKDLLGMYVSQSEGANFWPGVLTDLKLVYQAETLEKAEMGLENIAAKWNEKYPIVVRSWKVDDAAGKLVLNRSAAMHKVRGSF